MCMVEFQHYRCLLCNVYIIIYLPHWCTLAVRDILLLNIGADIFSLYNSFVCVIHAGRYAKVFV